MKNYEPCVERTHSVWAAGVLILPTEPVGSHWLLCCVGSLFIVPSRTIPLRFCVGSILPIISYRYKKWFWTAGCYPAAIFFRTGGVFDLVISWRCETQWNGVKRQQLGHKSAWNKINQMSFVVLWYWNRIQCSTPSICIRMTDFGRIKTSLSKY